MLNAINQAPQLLPEADLHEVLTPLLDEDEWSASRSGCFCPGERTHCHWQSGWTISRIGLGTVEHINSLICILKPTRCTDFSNLFLEWKSTCFGQFLCPSSGVIHCTHSSDVCHRVLQTACDVIYRDARSHERQIHKFLFLPGTEPKSPAIRV
jgi:hypothetical protein